jgi:hypothetical protein
MAEVLKRTGPAAALGLSLRRRQAGELSVPRMALDLITVSEKVRRLRFSGLSEQYGMVTGRPRSATTSTVPGPGRVLGSECA